MRSQPNSALATLRLPRRAWSRQRWSDAAFILMMTTGWVAGNVLALLGCVVAAFLVIAHGDFSVFMGHIDNVASRYVAADPTRQASFEREILVSLGIAGSIFFAIRLPRFVMQLRLELAQETHREG